MDNVWTMKKTATKRPDKHQISVPPDVWNNARPLLKDIGLTPSRFIQIVMRQLIDGQTKPFAQLQGELIEQILPAAMRAKKRKKT